MMRKNGEQTQKMRVLKALTFVIALVLVAPGVDALVRVFGMSHLNIASASTAERMEDGIDIGILARDNPFASLDRLEEAIEPDAALPEVFAREAGVPPGARDVRVSSQGNVVGYVVDQDEERAFVQLSEHMKKQGWTAVDLGDSQELIGATFVKNEGHCCWVLATCTQTGSTTSVVERYVIS